MTTLRPICKQKYSSKDSLSADIEDAEDDTIDFDFNATIKASFKGEDNYFVSSKHERLQAAVFYLK